MQAQQRGYSKRILVLVLAVAVVQVATLALAVLFGAEVLRNSRFLVEHSRVMMENNQAMMNEIFPSMRSGLSEIKGNTARIIDGVSALDGRVYALNEHMGQVRSEVAGAGKRLEQMDKRFAGWFETRGRLIWGNSLNPYIVLGLLVIACVNIPLAMWVVRRLSSGGTVRPALLPAQADGRLAVLERRLDELAETLSKARTEVQEPAELRAEWEKLVVATERFVEEAKRELAGISAATSRDQRRTRDAKNLQ